MKKAIKQATEPKFNKLLLIQESDILHCATYYDEKSNEFIIVGEAVDGRKPWAMSYTPVQAALNYHWMFHALTNALERRAGLKETHYSAI